MADPLLRELLSENIGIVKTQILWQLQVNVGTDSELVVCFFLFIFYFFSRIPGN
jgi:hypothetical protein